MGGFPFSVSASQSIDARLTKFGVDLRQATIKRL
jgi:hypothetical protein